jgi:hypothetical protein
MAPDRIDEWALQRAGDADPTGQQCAVQIDAIACIDHRLPIQRQVIGKLGHQTMRQQARAGQATFDRTARRWRLDDRVAAAARQFGTHVTDHAEAGRHIFQLLGHVLAQVT